MQEMTKESLDQMKSFLTKCKKELEEKIRLSVSEHIKEYCEKTNFQVERIHIDLQRVQPIGSPIKTHVLGVDVSVSFL